MCRGSRRGRWTTWPYVWLDATYAKVRQDGRIVSVAATIAVGANTAGRREVLGMAIGPSEAETFWTDFMRNVRPRSLMPITVSHDLKNLDANDRTYIRSMFERFGWKRLRGSVVRYDGRPVDGVMDEGWINDVIPALTGC